MLIVIVRQCKTGPLRLEAGPKKAATSLVRTVKKGRDKKMMLCPFYS